MHNLYDTSSPCVLKSIRDGTIRQHHGEMLHGICYLLSQASTMQMQPGSFDSPAQSIEVQL